MLKAHVVQVTRLNKSTVAERLETRNELVTRINLRLLEVEVVKSSVEQLPEVESVRAKAPTWQVEYNLAAWHGGMDAYKCALPYACNAPHLYAKHLPWLNR